MAVTVLNSATKEKVFDIDMTTFANGEIKGQADGFIGLEGMHKLADMYELNLEVVLDNEEPIPCVLNRFDVKKSLIVLKLIADDEIIHKRKHMRVTIKDRFNIKVKPTYSTAAVTGLDMSFGGMQIESNKSFNEGTEIIIEMKTTFNTFHFDGKIVNARKVDKALYRYGVQFTETRLRETQSDALYDYIMAWAKRNDLELR